MSAGLPYLRNLRKSDLVVLADAANLKDYEDLKKVDLEAALDDHLQANQSTLSKEPRFSAYYRRLSQGTRASPVKKEAKSEPSLILTDEPKRPLRSRRSARSTQEVEATDESEADSEKSKSPAPQTQTPARAGFAFPSLPPSPAVVTEVIDRQTTRVRKSVSEAWDASGATEHTNALRSFLSSVSTIEGIILVLELYCLASELIPLKFLTTFPAISAIRTPAFPVKVPDLFVLLSTSFWAPFSVWLTNSLIVPSLFAYFFNLSLKMSQSQAGHQYGTRRAAATQQATGPRANFDPLVFHVSKALVSYVVYASHFTFWNVFSRPSILRVSGALPGGVKGLLTDSAVCVLGSLYEAILRK